MAAEVGADLEDIIMRLDVAHRCVMTPHQRSGIWIGWWQSPPRSLLRHLTSMAGLTLAVYRRATSSSLWLGSATPGSRNRFYESSRISDSQYDLPCLRLAVLQFVWHSRRQAIFDVFDELASLQQDAELRGRH